MKTEIKYKVTSHARCSIFAYGFARVEYKKNKYVTSPEWLKEKGYYPFVFTYKEDALLYAKELNSIVFKVRVKGRHRKIGLPRILDLSCLGIKIVKKSIGAFPSGTEMWEYVKLLAEIK